MDVKFGAPHHFVSSRDGKVEEGNETKDRRIQETFVSNYDKVEQAERRAVQYDMMAVTMIRPIKDARARTPAKMFDVHGEPINMYRHWLVIDFNHVFFWQRAINKWGSAEDRQSSKWLHSFLYQTSTQDLRDRVDSQYKRLDIQF